MRVATMEMQQIKYFLAMSQELNFTRAAERCNVTQPALTRAIQALEAEFGGAVFHRERRHTHLSELGRMVLPYLESIQEQANDVKNVANAFGRLENGTLAIGTMCTIGPLLFSDFLMKFRADHPNIGVDIKDDSQTSLVEDLVDGKLEVALLAFPEGFEEKFHGLELFTERFVIVVSRHHRLARMNAVPVSELNEECYVRRSNCEYYDFVHEKFLEQGVRTKPVFSSERDSWVQGMIKAGMGLGFFPENSVTDPDLQVRPLVDPEFSRSIMLVTMRGRPYSPAVGAFVRQARTYEWPGDSKPILAN